MKKSLRLAMKQLNSENRKVVSNMQTYLACKNLNSFVTQDILFDIVGMSLENQQRGILAHDVFGEDYKEFCDALADNAPKQTFGESCLLRLTQVTAFLTLSLGLALLLSFGKWAGFMINEGIINIPIKHLGIYLFYGVLGVIGGKLLLHHSFTARRKMLPFHFLFFFISIFIYTNFIEPQLFEIMPFSILHEDAIQFPVYPWLLVGLFISTVSYLLFNRTAKHRAQK